MLKNTSRLVRRLSADQRNAVKLDAFTAIQLSPVRGPGDLGYRIREEYRYITRVQADQQLAEQLLSPGIIYPSVMLLSIQLALVHVWMCMRACGRAGGREERVRDSPW